MRRFWPPTIDDVSIRFWAANLSVLLNVVAGLFVYFRHQMEVLFFFLPGLFATMILTHQTLDEGGDGWLAWLGLIVGIATNLAFYYFLAWWVINAWRPSTNWWPEKRSKD